MHRITKECYEERFTSRIYEDSVLYHTFDSLIDKIIEKVLKERDGDD